MSKGFVFLAQNNENYDYVQQAYLLALSIRATQSDEYKICLVTNEKLNKKQKSVFDDVVEIPWEDAAKNSDWKIENRWKIYHATPYEENIVLDTDMIILQDISSWWDFLKNYNLFFTSKVYTYRGEVVSSDYYRKAFTENNLPNFYSGLFYFKKSDYAHDFFKITELIVNNWELFYGHYIKSHFPKRQSMDLTYSLAAKILDIENEISNNRISYPSFTHMKPKIQNWEKSTEYWQDLIGVYLTDDIHLKLGNFTQSGILHYTEKDFVNENIIYKYENYLGIKNGH